MNPDTTGAASGPGGRERFVRLLDGVRGRLSAYCRAMTRNADDAEDLASETIVTAYERLDDLRNDTAFVSWIFTIATRLNSRRQRRAKFFGLFDQERAEGIRYAGTAPDVSAEIRMLYDALGRLPAKQREAVVMFEISDLSLEEIREIQGGSLSGVKSRVTRGRERLAELLGVPNGPAPRGEGRSTAASGMTTSEINYFELHPSTER